MRLKFKSKGAGDPYLHTFVMIFLVGEGREDENFAKNYGKPPNCPLSYSIGTFCR